MYSNIYNDGQYHTNNPTWHKSDSLYKVGFIKTLLSKNKLEPKNVCEIGCGNGEIIKILSEQYKDCSFLGIDISQRAVELAQETPVENVVFQVADILENSFIVEDKFDLILTIDLIEHLENYFEYLRKINSMSTHTIFHIPLDMSIWTLFREKMLVESKNRVGHIHNFTETFILSVLEDMGYKIVDKIYTEPNYKPLGLKAKIVFTLRKMLFKLNKRFCSKTIGGLSLMVLTENKK